MTDWRESLRQTFSCSTYRKVILEGQMNASTLQDEFDSFRILEVSPLYPYYPTFGSWLVFVTVSAEVPEVVQAFVNTINKTNLYGVDLRGRIARRVNVNPDDEGYSEMNNSWDPISAEQVGPSAV